MSEICFLFEVSSSVWYSKSLHSISYIAQAGLLLVVAVPVVLAGSQDGFQRRTALKLENFGVPTPPTPEASCFLCGVCANIKSGPWRCDNQCVTV